MEIEEIIKAKRQLRVELTEGIENAISRFNNTTGLCPTNITINLVNVDTYGGEWQYCRVASVDIEVNIP